MVRLWTAMLNEAGSGIGKTLSEILVCPLSKQPLRLCEKTNSLISDAIGVSYPIKDGTLVWFQEMERYLKMMMGLQNLMEMLFIHLQKPNSSKLQGDL